MPMVASADAVEIDGILYLLNEADETAGVTDSYGCYSGNISIPPLIEYEGRSYSVTRIENHAFYNCIGLTSINIPNSVTSIGAYAFYGCFCLPSINIPNSVISIGVGAFMSCDILTTAILPDGLTQIEGETFIFCRSLTSINIPNSVTSIGNVAFCGCSSLTSINIPDNLTKIGSGAFEGCSGLTSIIVVQGNSKYDSRDNCNAIIETSSNTLLSGCNTSFIPHGVTIIGSWAFKGCSGLTSITIPHSVTRIRSGAFEGCSGLKSITIPNSVTEIGGKAFSGCKSLIVVYSMIENVFDISDYTFSDITYKNATLYVPVGTKPYYKNSSGWKQFVDKEEYPYYTDIQKTQQNKDVKITDSYQLDGKKRSTMRHGLNIVRMSDGKTKKIMHNTK